MNIDRNQPWVAPNGLTYSFTRNYSVNNYTHKNQLNQGIASLMFEQLVKVTALSKMACLNTAQREVDTPMLAIEKDDDYLGDFKTCVKESVFKGLADRNAKVAEALEKAAAKNQAAPLGAFEVNLNEDNADGAIDSALDVIKLSELREHDDMLYRAFKKTLAEKNRGGKAAAGGDDDE